MVLRLLQVLSQVSYECQCLLYLTFDNDRPGRKISKKFTFPI